MSIAGLEEKSLKCITNCPKTSVGVLFQSFECDDKEMSEARC